MILWKPSEEIISESNISRFLDFIKASENLNVSSFQEFYKWSVLHNEKFWLYVWQFLELKFSGRFSAVVDNKLKMPGAKWFEGTKLNFAENLLSSKSEKIALVSWNENGRQSEISYKDLYQKVARLAAALRHHGVRKGDVVAGYLCNSPEAVVGMLAASSLGAVWTSCSPDFSANGLVDRFSQSKPKILFASESYVYKGRQISLQPVIAQILPLLPSIQKIVLCGESNASDTGSERSTVRYDDFIGEFANHEDIKFEQVDFSDPLYILYSSGTTGVPKCIVHSVGGILIDHLKELVLDINLKEQDNLFYMTTCGWMMWNWMVSALSIGSTLVLYDGYPLSKDGNIIFDIIEKEKVSIFGTSAGFLQKAEEIGLKPIASHDLMSLRSILSTGSRLKHESFDYVYKFVAKDVNLSPIWGGTDLCGCLGTSSVLLPVRRGLLQTRSLGIDLQVVDSNGKEILNQEGEVVVKSAFPSIPLRFLNDQDNQKLHNTYFNKFEGVWWHGDNAIIDDEGYMLILGRADDTLNPGGIRIGPAEITNVAESFPEVKEAIAVAQRWQSDERVILFVILNDTFNLDESLISRITNAMPSPRHKPKFIFAVKDFPTTLSGKRSTKAIRDLLNGKEVQNTGALSNPEILDFYRNIPELGVSVSGNGT